MIPVRRVLVGGGYDPSSVAIFQAFTTPPTTQQQRLYDQFVRALKSSGVWPILDAIYLFAAANSQAALINLKNPGTFNATAVSSPTFTSNQGFTGNGTSSYVNSNFTPSTAGGNFQQNSAHASARSLSSVAASTTQRLVGIAAAQAGNRILIHPRTTGDLFNVLVNYGSPSLSANNANSAGHFLANRSDASAQQSYSNGSQVGSSTDVSVGNTNQAITFGADFALSSNFATLQMASGSIGGSLTASQVAALYAAEHAYMLGVGAVSS